MKFKKTIGLFTLLSFCCVSSIQAWAQTPAPQPERKVTTKKHRVSSSSVIVEHVAVAPQVVTILHRLNGLKVFRLLVRSRNDVGSIANLDEAFKMTSEVHTNVIAGLTLDDGRTIAAWLPGAEAEMPPSTFAPRVPAQPPATPGVNVSVTTPEQPVPPVAPVAIPGFPPMPYVGHLPEPADLKVITRDGKRLLGHYVGLDGQTGLSVISLSHKELPSPGEEPEKTMTVGQRLRVISPQPAPRAESGSGAPTYIRIAETEAFVVKVNRAPSGGVTRVKIKSPRLSAANIGGIGIADDGETLGIVDTVTGNEATMVPLAMVRSAAKRVIARQASVPRPWLGIRGEPIGKMSLERVLGVGWQPERARDLLEKRTGIFLTSVVPGSPAALNMLKPGDVILSVNNEDIRSGEELSSLMQEAGPGISLQFTIARPGTPGAQAFDIKLGESPDPFFGWRKYEREIERSFKYGSLLSRGIETVAIKPKVATRFGANGGLLVVYVQPSTAAYKAGLRPGDVIEAIDGKQLLTGASPESLMQKAGASCYLHIVRNRQKLVLTVDNSGK
ncbi:MAG TPA: PDZ domain-containing protein [Pyrinomonadaceae bacterium]|nr:PDZ domain-containing protein [Pyrinomonadaceae bacterium]